MPPDRSSPVSWSDAGVVATGASPHARLRPVPLRAVALGDGFWRPRREANHRAGIPSFLAWLDRDEQTEPFPTCARSQDASEISRAIQTLHRNMAGKNEHRLAHSWRANVQTLLEACAFTLQSDDAPAVRSLMDLLVSGVLAAHRRREFWDAYYGKDFGLSYQFALPGHLIQAAIAHHRVRGGTDFLDCACRVADAVVDRFGTRRAVDHPCIEMALVELYRSTGRGTYLETAGNFLQALLDQPGLIGKGCGDYEYPEGAEHFGRHVVRQTYLCAGGADYYLETGDAAFRDKLEAIWEDMARGKSHLTGALAIDYGLPERITAEPFDLWVGVFRILQDHIIRGGELCESVGNLYWNWRMLAARGEAKYADFFECVLYNSFLAHVSLDGARFFYVCPHATDGEFPPRTPWSHPETSCCSPNALRMIASVPGYFFSTSDEGIWVHLYDTCRLDWRLHDGTPLLLEIDTRYPWEGQVEIAVSPGAPSAFALNLRIPGWCTGASVSVNGLPVQDTVTPGSYCSLHREWNKGDRVRLDFAMPVLQMAADKRAAEFQGKTALMRGPIVYCFESEDQPGREAWDVRVPRNRQAREHSGRQLYEAVGEAAGFAPVFEAGLLGGVTALRGPDASGAPATAIPYFAWANRGPSAMRVWVGTANV